MGKRKSLAVMAGVLGSAYMVYEAYQDFNSAAADMKANVLLKHFTGIIREPVRQGYPDGTTFDISKPAVIYGPALIGKAVHDYVGGPKGFNINAAMGKLPFDIAI